MALVSRERRVKSAANEGAGHAGASLPMVRRVAVSLLARAGKSSSTRTRRLKAAWDDDYLLEVLQGTSIW